MPRSLIHAPVPALPTVRTVGLWRPFTWLALACKDAARTPWLSLSHGLALICVGWLILTIGQNRFWLLAGAFSGFLVVGPLVATSLYALSRALERGAPADAALVRRTWTQWQRPQQARLLGFGLLLSLAATGWVVVSASLVTVGAPVRVATLADFVQQVVLAPDGRLFAAWLALGSLLAAPIFASSVVAMPLLLDRQVTVRQAVLTSWLVVMANPVSMALWAACIVWFTLLGLGSLLLGLIVVMPVLGHASWHAYRDLVDASDFAAADAP